jgi:UDP-hydrolysing UDP-N-acetyl-D-glucosamine 2-epimerase
VVTGSRADYGIYRPVLRLLRGSPDCRLSLLVTGAHLSATFGSTVRAIEEDGFTIGARIDMRVEADGPADVARSSGLAVLGFAEALERERPDIVVVLGDRLEMLAAATASLPFRIPVAHIHGGESTEGAIDEAVRHAITKMSHLHFVALPAYARRVIQMGEAPWRVTVSGAPGLDALREVEPLAAGELDALLGLPLEPAPLLVTYHPVTLEYEATDAHMAELLGALDEMGLPVVFTFPGADVAAGRVIEAVTSWARTHPSARVIVNLGTRAYVALMRRAAAMVGNSSSGIIEAASFRLPVVNIGNRQRGRVRPGNVIDVECKRDPITEATRRAVSPGFRAGLADLVNPYGDGRSAPRIVERLLAVPLDDRLLAKAFHEVPDGGAR